MGRNDLTDSANMVRPARVLPSRGPWVLAALPLVVAGLVLVAAPHYAPHWAGYVFLIIGALLAGGLALVGQLINGRPAGVFIDNRNRLSLSKLQAAAWTVIVISAFATAAAYSAETATDYTSVQALDIQIPGQLLMAMGISATSLAATPALLSLKSSQTAAPTSISALPDGASAHGKLVVHDTADAASWSNLVTGDEVGNAQSPDLGKIQQILITVVLLGCYTAYVFASFNDIRGQITQLPAIDESFVWLLGLSHASYLAYKAAPHTQTGAPASPGGA